MRRPRANGRLAWLALALSILACLMSVVGSGQHLALDGRVFVDWVTYANAVERLLSGRSIFAPEQLAGPYSLPTVVRIGYAYPPPSVILFIPFAVFPVGLWAWIVLNVGLLVTGLFAVVQKEVGRLSPLAAAAILFGLAAFVPFSEGVASGNVNIGLAGVLAWAWVLGRSQRALGPISGLTATIKIVPGFLVFWSDRERFLRTAAGALAVAIGLTIVTLPFTGIGPWMDMFKALSNSQPICSGGGIHPSTACFFTPLVGSTMAKFLGILTGVVFGSAAVLTPNPLYAFTLVCLASLAPVADWHSHTFIVLYVLLVVAIARTAGMRAARVDARWATQDASGPLPQHRRPESCQKPPGSISESRS